MLLCLETQIQRPYSHHAILFNGVLCLFGRLCLVCVFIWLYAQGNNSIPYGPSVILFSTQTVGRDFDIMYIFCVTDALSSQHVRACVLCHLFNYIYFSYCILILIILLIIQSRGVRCNTKQFNGALIFYLYFRANQILWHPIVSIAVLYIVYSSTRHSL